ncbi:MAG TPA: metallophosphoesterase [Methanoregulaceae archaeon]|nr:MAG: metallophosphoesterase [Methanolinea sp.]HON80733.1 metallophosphoesterase [Methanoregulaceae archaeon]HPD09468.1 metallophosphoesterase [Methanoregulaceae archaeon]HRT14740.1 metallophosphoesterase [Methanoregulaceae archaeon]HRU30313.1 metallophosphoesterase [Methanoregulaceae archaeon]
MRIGILGDTHDHLAAIGKAVELLNREADDLFLHTGDFVSPFVIPVLAGLEGTVIGVFGNNDGDRDLLENRCRDRGNVQIVGNFHDMECEGLRVALLHGHENVLLADLIESGLFDLVVHGHTHQASVSSHGRTLVINPGEVCGYLTGSQTCALFDTRSRKGTILPLPGD